MDVSVALESLDSLVEEEEDVEEELSGGLGVGISGPCGRGLIAEGTSGYFTCCLFSVFTPEQVGWTLFSKCRVLLRA